jgi:hypothetical protein
MPEHGDIKYDAVGDPLVFDEVSEHWRPMTHREDVLGIKTEPTGGLTIQAQDVISEDTGGDVEFHIGGAAKPVAPGVYVDELVRSFPEFKIDLPTFAVPQLPAIEMPSLPSLTDAYGPGMAALRAYQQIEEDRLRDMRIATYAAMTGPKFIHPIVYTSEDPPKLTDEQRRTLKARGKKAFG